MTVLLAEAAYAGDGQAAGAASVAAWMTPSSLSGLTMAVMTFTVGAFSHMVRY